MKKKILHRPFSATVSNLSLSPPPLVILVNLVILPHKPMAENWWCELSLSHGRIPWLKPMAKDPWPHPPVADIWT